MTGDVLCDIRRPLYDYSKISNDQQQTTSNNYKAIKLA